MLFFIKIIFLIFQSNFRMYKNNFTKFGQKKLFFSLLLQYATVPPTVRFLTVATVPITVATLHMTVTTVHMTVATVNLTAATVLIQ